MAKVIRLKHLPDEADSADIRKFFKKVEIPGLDQKLTQFSFFGRI